MHFQYLDVTSGCHMHFVWHLTSSLRWVVDAVSWRRTPCWLDRGLFGKKAFAAARWWDQQ